MTLRYWLALLAPVTLAACASTSGPDVHAQPPVTTTPARPAQTTQTTQTGTQPESRPDWVRPTAPDTAPAAIPAQPQSPQVAPPVTRPVAPPPAPARPSPPATPVAPLAQPIAPPTQAAMQSLRFTATGFASLPNWSASDPGAGRRAFLRSCASMANRNPGDALSPLSAYAGRVFDWQATCARASDRSLSDRAFWETSFQPWQLTTTTDDPGHLTAYFEPVMPVSAVRTGTFVEPIQAPPADIVSIDPRLFDPNSNARQWFGRVENGRLVAYPPRAGINETSAPVLAWGEMGEVLSLQIQGSGRLLFPDGRQMRAAFAAHNGQTFGSVGRELIRRGELGASGASADAITAWFRTAEPARAREVMNANPRVVFFRLETIDDPSAGPRGAQGLPLEGNGAIAVDPAFHAYGVPFFIEAHSARLGNTSDAQFQRLVVAQDTGGAIRGPLRADLFWGTGVEAGLRAGRVSHNLRWWVLLPTGMDPAANLRR